MAFDQRDWSTAFDALKEADAESTLKPDDLERLAVTSRLLGKDPEAAEAWARAYKACLAEEQTEQAARYAFWRGFGHVNTGDMAQAGGWFGRAQKLLEESNVECVESGYLMVPMAIGGMDEDPAAALDAFTVIAGIAARFNDAALGAMARMGSGRSLIRLGRAPEGMPLLDEVIVAVSAGEVHPMVVGDLYCSAIEACWEIFDVGRAREWTGVLDGWCESQPDLVPYRGQCLVHRSQVIQMQGAWPRALEEVVRACDLFDARPGDPAIGLALYQCAELHRVLGELDEAKTFYGRASDAGHSPYPGLALVWLSQGDAGAAEKTMRRVVSEASDPVTKLRMLPASVEISLENDEIADARVAADELLTLARAAGASLLIAEAERAAGAVRLAEGDASGALDLLRSSFERWRHLNIPYEVARTRELIGLTFKDLGDEHGASIELDAARHTYEQLRAAPALSRLDRANRPPARADTGGLTGRELEVLRLVASGNTNRVIADTLVLSEKTVARHVSNIFMKLGLSSRAAATAYAYQHDLV